jgi:hypothetical protein
MICFTKPDCAKCKWLKSKISLEKYVVDVKALTPDNHDALALLAWYELVDKPLPILVYNEKIDPKYVHGAIDIKKYLEGL